MRDISDVYDSDNDLNGGLLLELNTPAEQWLVDPQPVQFGPGNLGPNSGIFFSQWRAWLSGDGSYFDSYVGLGDGPPANFYDLSAYGPPSDAFVFGTERNMISRILDDSDGDGFTDSFWFLAPAQPNSDLRQIVSVSITDNAGRLNVNTGTIYDRENTVGASPADVALVGDYLWNEGVGGATFTNNIERVGFFDNPRNAESYDIINPAALDNVTSLYGNTMSFYDIAMWDANANSTDVQQPENFLSAIGAVKYDLDNNGSFDRNTLMPSWYFNPGTPFEPFSLALDRLRYFQFAGSRPLEPIGGFTPFGIDDELELRMFEGQNYPWIASTFESAVQSRINNQTFAQLLRGNIAREETSEYLDQLNARELFFDARRKLTTYSNTRNDLMPPWLWWRWFAVPSPEDLTTVGQQGRLDSNNDGTVDGTIGGVDSFALQNFLAQSRFKLDLRESYVYGLTPTYGDLNYDNINDLAPGELTFDERLAWTLLLALTDGDNLEGDSYFGEYNSPTDNAIIDSRRLAAAYAANIKAWRTPGDTTSVANAEPMPELTNLFNANTALAGFPEAQSINQNLPVLGRDVTTADGDAGAAYLGLERQPFLLEAFVGHIYNSSSIPVPPNTDNGLPFTDGGQPVILDEADQRSTVVVVQLANPFDVPINLSNYRLNVFGQLYQPDFLTRPLDRVAGFTGIDMDGDGTLDPVLLPSRDEEPNTAVFYAIRAMIGNITDGIDDIGTWMQDVSPTGRWIDFLDISPIDPDGGGPLLPDLTPNSVVFDVNRTAPSWDVDTRDTYDNFPANEQGIELQKRDVNGVWVVVDRFDPPDELTDLNRDSFTTAVRQLEEDKPDDPPAQENGGLGIEYPAGWKICANAPDPNLCGLDHWVQWARATRAWGAHNLNDGLDPMNLTYGNSERNPRYISADRAVTSSRPKATNARDESNGDAYVVGDPPDGPTPWITSDYYRIDGFATPTLVTTHKPTFFDMNNGDFTGYPDKGWYGFQTAGLFLDPDTDPNLLGSTIRMNYPLQMMQKDANFDQVGELLNIWLFTHELTGTLQFNAVNGRVEFVLDDSDAGDGGTLTTFAEFMSAENDELVGDDLRINRLIVNPVNDVGFPLTDDLGEVVGEWRTALDPLYNYKLMFPDLPAGARVLDAFVCDGQGVVEDYDGDGVADVGNVLLAGDGLVDSLPSGDTSDLNTHYLENRRFLNANGFSGAGTPGLPNLNTAMPEVMRAMPFMDALAHRDPLNTINALSEPYVSVPQAIVHYRERYLARTGGILPQIQGMPGGADYSVRSPLLIRNDRGIESIGELMLLNKPAQFDNRPLAQPDWFDAESWRIDYAGRDPYSIGFFVGARNDWGANLSTDVNSNVNLAGNLRDNATGDAIAEDVEEANLLFAGISNIVSTRSDAFTIHFKIRSFRQNPITGIWDATDPEQIVDERRYVMLVDRSNVNKPGDKPQVLYLEKLPN